MTVFQRIRHLDALYSAGRYGAYDRLRDSDAGLPSDMIADREDQKESKRLATIRDLRMRRARIDDMIYCLTSKSIRLDSEVAKAVK